MFKAIGKWGASVKANLNLKFISSIFGSKSKSYNNIESDEEEIFSDAREDLLDDDDHQDTLIHTDRRTECHTYSDVAVNGSVSGPDTDLIIVQHPGTSRDSVQDREVTDVTHVHDTADHDQNGEDEDEHHKTDSDRILASESKPSNGIIRSASSSAFKKVHRRINSYSQRQYSKFEDHGSAGDSQITTDSNDNIDGSNGAISDVQHTYGEKSKKSQKRNKVLKRTRRALRGSWKWMKRGMLGYARGFQAPTFVIFNMTGPSQSRRY